MPEIPPLPDPYFPFLPSWPHHAESSGGTQNQALEGDLPIENGHFFVSTLVFR